MTNVPRPTPTPLPPGVPPPTQVRARPSGWWYVLVPILFLAGIAFAVVAAVDEGRDVADSFSTLGVDGRGTVDLEAGDTATVMAFWEDGRSTESITRPAATVTVTGPGGTPVSFDAASGGRQTFSINSRSGIDLGTFEAGTSGTHEVRVDFAEAGGVPTPPLAAVGRLDWRSIVSNVLRPIGFGAAASIGLWLLLLVLRGASKRRQRTSPQDPGATPRTSGTTQSRGPFV